MSPIVFLIGLSLVLCVAMLGTAMVASIKSGARRSRKQVRAYEKALRAIANGAGNPSLEAQIVLDQQNELES